MLAEDLLLLLFDDETGRGQVDATRMDLGLAGAVLVVLVEAERVRISEPGEDVKAGRVVVVNHNPTGDVVLDDALAQISERRPAKPESVIPKIKG